jgi:hypothetical protein
LEKVVKTIAALSLLAVMAACNKGGVVEDYVAPVATVSPVTVEPVFAGKYN